MKENSHIDKKTFDYVKSDKPKAERFYLLPKTNPGRPTNVSNWTRHSVGGYVTALWSQASRHAR
jgi:hypothetical protein